MGNILQQAVALCNVFETLLSGKKSTGSKVLESQWDIKTSPSLRHIC